MEIDNAAFERFRKRMEVIFNDEMSFEEAKHRCLELSTSSGCLPISPWRRESHYMSILSRHGGNSFICSMTVSAQDLVVRTEFERRRRGPHQHFANMAHSPHRKSHVFTGSFLCGHATLLHFGELRRENRTVRQGFGDLTSPFLCGLL